MRGWLHDHLGRRGYSLLWFGALDFVYAYVLATARGDAGPTYAWFRSIAPLDLWAGVWAAVGVICVAAAAMRTDRIGFGAALGVKLVWGIVAAAGAVTDGLRPSVIGYLPLGLAGLVWIIAGWRETDEDTVHEDRAA